MRFEDKFFEKAKMKHVAEQMDQSSIVRQLKQKEKKRQGKKKADLHQDKTLKQEKLQELLGSMNLTSYDKEIGDQSQSNVDKNE